MTTHDLVLAAMFAALIVVLGIVPALPIAFVPVPITLQSFGVMLAGALLGPRRGAIAAALVVVLVVIGLPVLAGGRGGLAVLAGPTAGFLLGWIPAAFVTGLVGARLAPPGVAPRRRLAVLVLACILGGIGVDYLCGIAWLVAVTGIEARKAALGMLAFLPGDGVKAVLAASVATAIQRVHPIAPR